MMKSTCAIAFNGFVKLFLLIVLCTAAHTSVTSAQADSEPVSEYEIKLITYNITGLPDFVTYARFPNKRIKEKMAPAEDRFNYVGVKLKSSDYDIIGLQEMFVTHRSIIEQKLGAYYVAHGTDVGVALNTGSGVYTFSRWPIWRIYFERWRKSRGADALSHKGFVLTTIKVDDQLSIDVYNLHAQAGSKERIDIDNMYQLIEAMERMSLGNNRHILVMGDFNCRLGSEQCNIFIDGTGVDTVFKEQDSPDHIFYHQNGSGWVISVDEYATVLDEKLDGEVISGHNALEATLKFTKK